MITLPPMEPVFARALLVSAKRDADAMTRAFGLAAEHRQQWSAMSVRVQSMIDDLPVPAVVQEDDLIG